MELGRPRLGLGPASRSAALYPGRGEPFSALAEVHAALGETEAAREALERSLGADWRGNEDGRREAERALQKLGTARTEGN